MKIIDSDGLEPDTEWSDYYDGFVSYSQGQIDAMEEVKAIPLEKVKQVREEMKEHSYSLRCFNEDVFDEDERVVDLDNVLIILDKLIEEVEEDTKAGDHERTV